MPTETTASLLVNLSDSFFGGDVFDPTSVALLHEGSRPTWTLHSTTLQRPRPTATIRPTSTDHLLAVGLLGYAVIGLPQILADDDPLVRYVNRRERSLEVECLDDQTAQRVFTRLGEFITGVFLVLPGCTTTDAELAMASEAGFKVASPVNDGVDPTLFGGDAR